MAVAHGMTQGLERSTKSLTYADLKGMTVVKEKIAHNTSKSPDQEAVRTSSANRVNAWRAFDGTLKPSFEKVNPRSSNYTLFIAKNGKVARVYLPKEVARNRGCVLANFIIGEGPLPAITVTESSGTWLTNIDLGDLEITPQTTVAQFTYALMMAPGFTFDRGDRVAFYRACQKVDRQGELVLPRAKVYTSIIVLDLTDGSTLYSHAGPDGFQTTAVTVDGATHRYLSAPMEQDTMVAWMPARTVNDRTVVGYTTLHGPNSLLAQYTTPTALYDAAKSYGPVKAEDYLSRSSNEPYDPRREALDHYEREHGIDAPGTGTGSTPGTGNTGGGTGNTDPTNPPANPPLGGDGEDGFSR